MAKQETKPKYEKYFLKDVTPGSRRPTTWFEDPISISPKHMKTFKIEPGGIISAIQKPYMFHAPLHTHLFTEYFLFWGSNPYDMKQFDGEAHYTFGPEGEKHIIKEPTIVIAAPGVYHCPLNYVKVDKPFYCMEVFITKGYSGVDFGEDLQTTRVTEPSYDRYFTNSIVKRNKWGEEGIELASVPAHTIPPNSKINVSITAVKRPHLLRETTHKHNTNEYFYFWGSNPYNMKEFDAEIEFYFGEEQEKHVINQPTIVVVPPGMYHAPVNFKKVGKPFYYARILPAPEYSSTDLVPKK